METGFLSVCSKKSLDDYKVKFLRCFDIDKQSGCWIWNKKTQAHGGYGLFGMYRKRVRAHRVSLILFKGITPLPAYSVCHKCDNPRCVNPDHLFIGTHEENMRDCLDKGRAFRVRGQRSGRAVVTDEQATLLLKMAGEGKETRNSIARRMSAQWGISEHTLKMILYRFNWKHLG